MADDDARSLVLRAVAEWNRGDHYDAHETLEEVVDLVEDDDGDWAIGLALVRVAASMHKLANEVGPRAVPGKVSTALDTLRETPAVWFEIDLEHLIGALEGLLSTLQAGETPETLPKLVLTSRDA